MNSPIRSFCSANTCSTRERIFDFALLARRIVSCIARPFGFLRWMWLTKPFFFRKVSFGPPPYGLSGHHPPPRLVGPIGPPPPPRIALVEQALAQTTALIRSRICGRPSADEAETEIDRDMVLIAK